MSAYQHKKGKIQDNALEALLHDPLFRQRIEKNKKGKGSYCRKGKQGKGQNWEASGKSSKDALPLASHLIYPSYFKLHVRWLRSFTRITYLSKLIGIPSLAAFLQLELFRV